MADQPLSMDLLIEVLIRLPVKSILKFRCVSKTWRDLIRSPLFIHGHQTRKGKQRVMLVKRYSPQQNGDGEVFSFSDPSIPIMDDLYGHLHMICQSLPPTSGDCETFSSNDEFLKKLVSLNLSIPIRSSWNIPWQRHSNILFHGPCNGLVCIAFEKTVFLSNPALREFKLLPPPGFHASYRALPLLHGFGFDPITGAYKVIQISDMTYQVPGNQAELWYRQRRETNSLRIDLYNSASDSWKQIHGEKLPYLSYLPGYELFYNGAIHWAIIAPVTSPRMLCFDVRTETFRQLHFHDNFCRFERDLRLMEFNEKLAVVRYAHPRIEPFKTEIWVMTEYGVKGSWTKQFVITPYCDICPFMFLKNDLLLAESGNGQSASCALHENQFKGFQFYGAHSPTTAVFYEESLISLNEIIASDRSDE